MYRCSRCNRRRSCIYNCPCMNNNSCNNSNPFPENYLYGHAYTPIQTMNETYNPEIGLENGTIFPELVSPYCPGDSIEFIEYLKNGGIKYEQ